MNNIKKTVCVLMLWSLILGIIRIQAAAESIPGYRGDKCEGIWSYGRKKEDQGLPGFKNSDKVKLTTSDKSIMTAYADDKNDKSLQGGVRWFHYIIKRSGYVTVTCTVTRGKKRYITKHDIYIKKYSNPVKSFKIGGKELKNGFNRSPFMSNSYKVKGKKKIAFTTKQEYKLFAMYVYTDNGTKILKRSENINFSKVNRIEFIMFDTKNPKCVFEVYWSNRY